jgi:hypothetical protein
MRMTLRVTAMLVLVTCWAPGTLGASNAAKNPELKVSLVDLALPVEKDAAKELLWDEFVQGQQTYFRSFSSITTEHWQLTWDSHQQTLIRLAKEKGLRANELKACLARLNYGRTSETALWPSRNITSFFIPPGTTEEEYRRQVAEHEAKEAAAEVAYQQKLTEREKNIEAWYDEDLAIAPVAAYQAKYAERDCWIIVCIWELGSDEPVPLGHVMT